MEEERGEARAKEAGGRKASIARGGIFSRMLCRWFVIDSLWEIIWTTNKFDLLFEEKNVLTDNRGFITTNYKNKLPLFGQTPSWLIQLCVPKNEAYDTRLECRALVVIGLRCIVDLSISPFHRVGRPTSFTGNLFALVTTCPAIETRERLIMDWVGTRYVEGRKVAGGDTNYRLIYTEEKSVSICTDVLITDTPKSKLPRTFCTLLPTLVDLMAKSMGFWYM